MRSFVRKLVAGTLLCSMTLTQVPVWNVPKMQIKAEGLKVQEETSGVKLTRQCAFMLSLKKGWDAKDCTFKSENENIVQVSKEGIVFGVSAGTANVVVTHKTGDSFSCKVDVNGNDENMTEESQLKEEIFLAGIWDSRPFFYDKSKGEISASAIWSELVLSGEGDSRQVVPFISGSKYTREDVTYTVSDESIVCVKNETIYAKAPGKAVVTLSLPNGIKKDIHVEVEATAIETRKVFLAEGASHLLTLKRDWEAKDCTFESEDENIVQVSKEGVLMGISAGTAAVIIRHKTGGSFFCMVNVYGTGGFDVDHEKISETATITGVRECYRECPPGGIKELYIPEYSYNGTTDHRAFEIVRIRNNAFEGQKTIEKVVLPKTIQIIQKQAFKDCEALKTVVFGGMETDIAEDAFEGTNATFFAYKGSAAEKYAAAHDNIAFQEISEDTKIPKVKEEILLANIYERVEEVPYAEEGKTIKEASSIESTLFMKQEEKEVQLIPFVSGSNYTREDITYTVSDESIVSVENETVHAKTAGKTVITLSLPNGVKKELNVVVEGKKKTEETTKVTETTAPTVTDSVASTEVPKATASAVPTEAPKATETAIPTEAPKAIETAIPTETPDTTNKNTATSSEKKRKKTSLTWKAKKQTIKVGKTYTFCVTVKNSNQKVKWTVSDKKIAVIQAETGKLKAKKPGKVTVTAKCNGVKKTCVVTVKK